jgi:hypothetical protein
MPLKETETGVGVESRGPEGPHLLLLTSIAPVTWAPIPEGAVMAVRASNKDQLIRLIIAEIKVGRMGRMEVTFQCCTNPKCTRTLKMEGQWLGHHQNLLQEGIVNAKDSLK